MYVSEYAHKQPLGGFHVAGATQKTVEVRLVVALQHRLVQACKLIVDP